MVSATFLPHPSGHTSTIPSGEKIYSRYHEPVVVDPVNQNSTMVPLFVIVGKAWPVSGAIQNGYGKGMPISVK